MSPPRSVRTWRPILRIRPLWRIWSGLDSSHFSRSCCRCLLFRERVLLDVCIARFDAAGDTPLEGQLDQLFAPVGDGRRRPCAGGRRRGPRRPACGCAAGRRTRPKPPRCAASTFSAMPPTASTWVVEGDLAFIARPRTGRPVKADTGAATIVTPAEVPSLGAPRPSGRTDARRCRDAKPRSRPCRAAGRASRAVLRPGGRQRARRPRDHLLYGRR